MIRDRLISISNNLYIIIFNLISLYRYYISLIDIISSSNKKGIKMDIVGECKIIRITNNKNGLFKELDFHKYTKDDILKIYITNRDAGVMILNSDKKWTTLKSFNEFGFYNNIASEFLVDVSKYLNSFYNTDEFNTLTD